ncbi:hypothetical protein CQ018_11995 [Arthrobacter sp. MYb227]|uniref:bifunctional glycosyltransferase/CDP-glycerol:glycerophosphate glycerophosphotransferase n=1 Tax=Arthrobacter sp. MYb227 TaxID=1848601 RepID=UPI000CFCE5DC|nr:CDP-glycerol glycerophosphotransferase family protein [Arthrobacter sp. MYb227]PQZ92229.1 hypothetical protein CQ018_11995 [Arthrobacter sp. MYb227]
MNDPLISVILAVYDVEEYVEATLTSLDRQTYESKNLEFIIVNDGSTDMSLEKVTRWAKDKSNVTVISQENQGAGAARKAALELVTGDWVTVVDPDDILDRDYFSAIARFIKRDESNVADMLITRILVLNGTTGRVQDTHPLAYRFKNGSRLVSLKDEPSCIQLGATAVLRVARLRDSGLTYDPRIEPTFEDAHLLGRYLATTAEPVVGVVADAKYYYRKRFDQSSLVQSSWSTEDRYSTVLELGYLDMLRQVTNKLGETPVWAQTIVLYDIAWYFKEDTQQHSRTAWISGELRDNFINSLYEIFSYIDKETIENFSVNPIWWSLRQTILSYFKADYLNSARTVQWGSNTQTGSNQYCILYSGIEPELQIFVDGLEIQPTKDDYTTHSYFGIPMMVERNITIGHPGSVRILIDGNKAQIERAGTSTPAPKPANARYRLAPIHAQGQKSVLAKISGRVIGTGRIEKFEGISKKASSKLRYVTTRLEVESLALSLPVAKVLGNAGVTVANKRAAKVRELKEQEHATQLKKIAAKSEIRERYRDAWVVMDRPMRADDNGEHLYRYLLTEREDVNAFFLLSKNSSDWSRLKSEGFRLVDYASDEAVSLLLNAKFRMSSDAVAEVMYPISRRYYDLSKSKFIFLQHGVTKDDLSRWLNPKKLDGVICATQAEYDSFVGINSPYTIRKHQALLSGFPRFDGLHRAQQSLENDPDLLLIMPTWRQYLRDEIASASNEEEARDIFSNSEFGENWLQFLRAPELSQIAQRSGLKIGFIAHPAFASMIEYLDVPSYVEVLEPEVHGFQNLLARAAVFITDYSSVAFDTANLGIPVVYFQFDPEQMFGGGHNFRRGYFDYSSDGFGPVCATAADAIAALEESLDSNSAEYLEEYRRRTTAAFAFQDTENSKRVAEMIERL